MAPCGSRPCVETADCFRCHPRWLRTRRRSRSPVGRKPSLRPLRAVLLVPQDGLQCWHVHAIARAEAAGRIWLDAIIETPRQASSAAHCLMAGVRLADRLIAIGRRAGPLPELATPCSPEDA